MRKVDGGLALQPLGCLAGRSGAAHLVALVAVGVGDRAGGGRLAGAGAADVAMIRVLIADDHSGRSLWWFGGREKAHISDFLANLEFLSLVGVVLETSPSRRF